MEADPDRVGSRSDIAFAVIAVPVSIETTSALDAETPSAGNEDDVAVDDVKEGASATGIAAAEVSLALEDNPRSDGSI